MERLRTTKARNQTAGGPVRRRQNPEHNPQKPNTGATTTTGGRWGRTSAWGDPTLQRTVAFTTPQQQRPTPRDKPTPGHALETITPPPQTPRTLAPHALEITTPPPQTPRTLAPHAPGTFPAPVPLPTLPFLETLAYPLLPHWPHSWDTHRRRQINRNSSSAGRSPPHTTTEMYSESTTTT